MKIILIGIQGAGKSTQGNILSKKLGIPYLSTGHIFRDMAKEKTKIGRYLKEIMVSGALVPDKTTLEIVTEYLKRPEYKDGYIMDGFPRTISQAKAFKNGIDWAVYLKVLDKEALWRLSYRTEEREDETLEALRKRIELFHEVTKPVTDYYKGKRKLIEIDGEKEIAEISREILRAVKK